METAYMIMLAADSAAAFALCVGAVGYAASLVLRIIRRRRGNGNED